MDPVQLTIIIISFILTTLVVILSIQVWHILGEFRLTAQKVNKMLDDGGKVTGVISDTATSVAGFISGIKTGMNVLSLFKKKNISFVIVDFNPEVYKKLTAENYPVIFGDIADPEILEAVSLDQAKLIISTIDGLTDNLVLLEYIRKLAKKPLSIFTASTRTNALKFYESGANYVIVPDVVAGDHIRHIIKTYGFSGDKLAKVGKNHFNRLIFT